MSSRISRWRSTMQNRTICDVLEAIRKCSKTGNYSYLLGLVEEAQDMANRMESALWDQADFKYQKEEYKKLKKKCKEMEDKLEEEE